MICSENQGFSGYADSNIGIVCHDQVVNDGNTIKFIIENPNNVTQMFENSKNFITETFDHEPIVMRHHNLNREFSYKKL